MNINCYLTNKITGAACCVRVDCRVRSTTVQSTSHESARLSLQAQALHVLHLDWECRSYRDSRNRKLLELVRYQFDSKQAAFLQLRTALLGLCDSKRARKFCYQRLEQKRIRRLFDIPTRFADRLRPQVRRISYGAPLWSMVWMMKLGERNHVSNTGTSTSRWHRNRYHRLSDPFLPFRNRARSLSPSCS